MTRARLHELQNSIDKEKIKKANHHIFEYLAGEGFNLFEVSIKHIVDYKCLGIYIETDLLQDTITVGKGKKRIRLNLLQAKKMKELLEKQISRIDAKYCDK